MGASSSSRLCSQDLDAAFSEFLKTYCVLETDAHVCARELAAAFYTHLANKNMVRDVYLWELQDVIRDLVAKHSMLNTCGFELACDKTSYVFVCGLKIKRMPLFVDESTREKHCRVASHPIL